MYTIAELLQQGTEPNAETFQGLTALETAIQAGSKTPVILALLAAGAQPTDQTLLHAVWCDVEPVVLRELIEAGANPSGVPATNPDIESLGQIPMHMAAYRSPQSIPVLAEAGADPNVEDANGLTPLHLAILSQHPATRATKAILSAAIAELLRVGADPDLRGQCRQTPGEMAAEYGVELPDPD